MISQHKMSVYRLNINFISSMQTMLTLLNNCIERPTPRRKHPSTPPCQYETPSYHSLNPTLPLPKPTPIPSTSNRRLKWLTDTLKLGHQHFINQTENTLSQKQHKSGDHKERVLESVLWLASPEFPIVVTRCSQAPASDNFRFLSVTSMS